jgi:hypothetical protein
LSKGLRRGPFCEKIGGKKILLDCPLRSPSIWRKPLVCRPGPGIKTQIYDKAEQESTLVVSPFIMVILVTAMTEMKKALFSEKFSPTNEIFP